MKSIRDAKRASILSPLLVTTEALVETLIPFLMANIIDDGITPGNLNYILRWGIVLIFLALISLGSGAGASWFSSVAGAKFARNLRHDLYYQIQDFSFQNIDHFSSSSLVTRMTTDVTNIQNAYQLLIRVAVRAPLMLLFSIIMAFTVSAKLAMVFVVAVPFLALGLWVILHFARPLFQQVFHRYDRLNRVVEENVRGVRVVKTYVRQETEISKFDQAAQAIFDVFSKAQKIVALNGPLMQLVIDTTMIGLSWFGAKLIVSHQLQTGQLVSMFSYANAIMFGLMMLSMIFTQLSIAQASAERIVAVLSEGSSITNPAHPVMTVENGDVDFNHVDFSYTGDPKDLQLTDIDLHIKSGQMVGVLGETGSGKSSLVQLIPRLYDATSGTVEVADRPVGEYDLRTLRDNVAMVLQNNVLFSGTIKTNLRWGNPSATDEQMIAACKLAQIDDFVQGLPDGYDTRIEQNGSNVSGGQMQRLCIARALLKNPKILILDDSTSAVDTNTDAAIREAFHTDMPNVTKIMITQRIASIADADQIVLMNHGRIEAIGKHKDLLAHNQDYQAIYKSQTREEDAHHAS
ncbi:ABC-type multidrug transport system, ATPase and permease [Lactobacillus selangorensis]|uniref:ABC-type multidrug transport system, ATPase and permease n=2 Tax=Lactobacillus selangorensis TaxID=81857 RepID=A0A0R2FLQ7_9LACO|nr:ABC-type multidrug transport system, ATPase and permease [Lactobacillus selangorensis]KRN32880.1 ABC-type multidrug transport system, ATPase and permease [Lactobacillus selangorensis]